MGHGWADFVGIASGLVSLTTINMDKTSLAKTMFAVVLAGHGYPRLAAFRLKPVGRCVRTQ
jgi:hypothetical protein